MDYLSFIRRGFRRKGEAPVGITIGSGFYASPGSRDLAFNFAPKWHRYNIRPMKDATVYIVDNAAKGCSPRHLWWWYGYKVVKSDHNVGSWLHLWGRDARGRDAPVLCGWTLSWMITAMCAYNRGTDFVYIEQDCLCDGNWLELIQAELWITGAAVLFGKSKHIACEQSLFYVKWSHIPWFLGMYLQFPSEEQMLCEDKFAYIAEMHPDLVGRHSVGPGRDRPIPKSGARSAQHLSYSEIENF